MKNLFVLLLLFLIMTISLEANLRHLPIIPPIIIKPPTPPTPCPEGTKLVYDTKEKIFKCEYTN